MRPTTVASNEGSVLNVLGHTQRLLITGAQTGGSFALIEQVSPPGTGVPLHVHQGEDETFYVLEGRVEITRQGAPTGGGPGTTVYLPRGVAHTFQAVGRTPARVLILLTPAGLERMFQELAELPPGAPDMAKVTEICERHRVTFVK